MSKIDNAKGTGRFTATTASTGWSIDHGHRWHADAKADNDRLVRACCLTSTTACARRFVDERDERLIVPDAACRSAVYDREPKDTVAVSP